MNEIIVCIIACIFIIGLFSLCGFETWCNVKYSYKPSKQDNIKQVETPMWSYKKTYPIILDSDKKAQVKENVEKL